MNQMDKEKREYELSFLLKNKEAAGDVETLLAQYGAEVFNRGPFLDTRLAYSIKKHNQAVFGFLHFKALPDSAEKITQSLKLNPLVLRTLLVTPPISKSERAPRFSNVTEGKPGRVKVSESVPVVVPKSGALTNEALEEKLEEILK